MSRPSVFLRRAGLGCAGLTVVLGIAGGVLYKSRYVLPPEAPRSLREPTPNAYQTMIAACKLEVKELDGIKTSPPNRNSLQPLAGRKKLLAANAASIAKLREALGQEWLTPQWMTASQTFPEYAQFREEARMLTLLGTQTYAEEGNLPEAARCAADAIELGMKIPRGGVLITGLVGLACEAIGESALWRIADTLDAKTARVTSQRLVALEPQRTSFAQVLEEERRFGRLSTRQLFAKSPTQLWKAVDQEFFWGEHDQEEESPKLAVQLQLTWLKAQILYYGPKTTIDEMDRWMRALAADSEKPWQANRPLPPLPTDPLGQLTAPVFSQAGFKWFQTRTNRALCITYLALRAYRLEKGGDAPSLDALVVAGYVKAVPADPFSPTHAPLRYQAGKLWSVGPDAKDDGGKPIDMEGKKGFVNVEKTGDIVARVNTW